MKIHCDGLSAVGFSHWDIDDSEIGVLVVKGSFSIAEIAGGCDLLPARAEMLMTDVFHGEPNISSLRQESELVPWQDKTNILFNAVARSPEGKELEGWPVRIGVDQKASLAFEVCGARFWEPEGVGRKKWKLTRPRKMTELPLLYEYAYGGQTTDADGVADVHEFNPVGRGFLGKLKPDSEMLPAPQIGLQAEFAAADPAEPMAVRGVGPVGKAWLPRRTLAGTFDESWLRERHPRMPEDYSFAFWNGAASALQIGPYLKGDEIITVTGMRHDPRPWRIALPAIVPRATVRRHNSGEEESFRLVLQTVHCDLSDAAADKHWISLVWRTVFDTPSEIAEVAVTADRRR